MTEWKLVSDISHGNQRVIGGVWHDGSFYQAMGRLHTINIAVGFRKYKRPTHWMTLPEPPEEDKVHHGKNQYCYIRVYDLNFDEYFQVKISMEEYEMIPEPHKPYYLMSKDPWPDLEIKSRYRSERHPND